jgi:hypothetical protein
MSKKQVTEQNGPYQRKEMCATIHVRVDEKLSGYEDDIKSINRKINATLIFALITTIGIIVNLLLSR